MKKKNTMGHGCCTPSCSIYFEEFFEQANICITWTDRGPNGELKSITQKCISCGRDIGIHQRRPPGAVPIPIPQKEECQVYFEEIDIGNCRTCGVHRGYHKRRPIVSKITV